MAQIQGEKQIYILENLGCAHCAAKMEEELRALPGVAEAVIIFVKKELHIKLADTTLPLEKLQAVCQAVESDVQLVARTADRAAEKVPEKTFDREKLEIAVGAVLLAITVWGSEGIWQLGLAIFAYLLLGRDVLRQAMQNIRHGRALDENFLMAVATIGAFAIGEGPEGVGVMLFYRLGEFFEERAVEKSRKAVLSAAELQPEIVHLKKDGVLIDTAVADVNSGDILVIRPGERIAADAVVLEGESRMDTAAVTGEPVPVRAEAGTEIFSGYLNINGVLSVQVLRPASESMAARILAAVESAAAGKPKMERFISRFARVYTPLVVGIAVLTAVVPPLFTGDFAGWFYTALTFLVISCPCALVLSVPLSFFAAIGAGSKQGILFKSGSAIETLSKVEQVIFDKTGTLTKGNFVLQEMESYQEKDSNELLQIAAAVEMHSTHPIAVSIVAEAKKRGLITEPAEEIEEIAGHGIRAMLGGQEILFGNEKLMEQRGFSLPESSHDSYGTRIYMAFSGKVQGLFLVADEIKNDAGRAIRELQAKGLTLAMLTGDSPEAAGAVSRTLGISRVEAGLLPEDKLSRLQQMRQEHGRALFVGDGINDAPVLAGADCSASMGSGAAMAVEAADIVFLTNRMQAVGQAVRLAKKATGVAWQNIIFAIGAKAAIMVLGFFGYASLWLAIFADTGVALLCVLNAMRLLKNQPEETAAA